MKKGTLLPIIILSVIVLIMALYAACFFWISPKMHDVVLNQFSTELFSVELPSDTTQIDSISVVGQQIANGNHCDYLAARLLQTTLSKSELETHFAKGYQGKSKTQFVWLEEDNAYTIDSFDSSKIYSLEEWLDQKSTNSKANVVVYTFEPHMTSSFDYRCR